MMKLKFFRVLFCLFVGIFLCAFEPTAFAEPTGNGDEGRYLSAYQEPTAPPTGVSWWSTFAYLLSLLVVFLFVAALAYLASRFLGSKLGALEGRKSGKVLENLPLGANKSICAVEVAGKVLLLGVTEQSITLLEEVTDELEIARLRSAADEQVSSEQFPRVFERQLLSLEKISRNFPSALSGRKNRK